MRHAHYAEWNQPASAVVVICICCLAFISNRCPAPEFCSCSKFTPTGENTGDLRYRDYQEIKVQEHVQMLDIGTIPRSLWVVLEDDLVDICKPGDDVTIT